MATITTNTSGTQPVIEVSTYGNMANAITIPFLQDVTITNSTGIYSYTTFSDADTRKLSTPADNEISTNIVLDIDAYFGTTGIAGNNAAELGLVNLSGQKDLIYFNIYYAGNVANAHYASGQGFITSLAPTVAPENPIWISPLTIAVDGGFTDNEVP